MGGGTTVVEAMSLGRRVIGTDLNSLAVFVATVKTTCLSPADSASVRDWACKTIPKLRCTQHVVAPPGRSPKNMNLPSVRWLRKTIALAMAAAENEIQSSGAFDFARCVLLNVGQWALNGRKVLPSAQAFRERITTTALEMLADLNCLNTALRERAPSRHVPLLRQLRAESIHCDNAIVSAGKARLVVTSPPYPGIHMLYHRWQVDGRRESDAPYWISGCEDGAGAAYYNFSDRRREVEDRYFQQALAAFSAIRQVMQHRGYLIQLIAFSDPSRQLPKYLDVLQAAGLHETHDSSRPRTWRPVPSRRWHANSKGNLPSSREVLLVHRAV